MFRVFIEGLELNGKHGVTKEERLIGHRFLIDIELTVDGNADISDDINDTVNYAEASYIAQGISDSKSYLTVEAFAGAIADGLLGRFDLVREVRVRVAKLLPPLDVVVGSAGAEVSRTRAS